MSVVSIRKRGQLFLKYFCQYQIQIYIKSITIQNEKLKDNSNEQSHNLKTTTLSGVQHSLPNFTLVALYKREFLQTQKI